MHMWLQYLFHQRLSLYVCCVSIKTSDPHLTTTFEMPEWHLNGIKRVYSDLKMHRNWQPVIC